MPIHKETIYVAFWKPNWGCRVASKLRTHTHTQCFILPIWHSVWWNFRKSTVFMSHFSSSQMGMLGSDLLTSWAPIPQILEKISQVGLLHILVLIHVLKYVTFRSPSPPILFFSAAVRHISACRFHPGRDSNLKKIIGDPHTDNECVKLPQLETVGTFLIPWEQYPWEIVHHLCATMMWQLSPTNCHHYPP